MAARTGVAYEEGDRVALRVTPSSSTQNSSKDATPLSSQYPSRVPSPGAVEGGDMLSPISPDALLKAGLVMRDVASSRESFCPEERAALSMYMAYHSWQRRAILHFCVVVVLALALFEEPNGSLGLKLPIAATEPVECLCLLFFCYRLTHLRQLLSAPRFWKDKKNVALVATIAFTFVDIAVFSVTESLGVWNIRWSRVLRPLFLAAFSDYRQVRRGFRTIRRAFAGVVNVLILVFVTIGLFALLCVQLLKRKNLIDKNGDEYMTSWPDAFWDLYVLITSANFPDVMMPAYGNRRWYALIFVSFIVVTMYVFLSIVLAVVYNNYREGLKTELKNGIRTSRRDLRRVFEYLAIENAIMYREWVLALQYVFPKYDSARFRVMWRVVCPKNRTTLRFKDFQRVYELLHIPLVHATSGSTLLDRYMPGLYHSRASQMLKDFTRHKYFKYSVSFAIVLNAFLIGVGFDRQADPYFLTFFNLEIILKIYTFGTRNYFRRPWNCFDFVVILGATILSIYDSIAPLSENEQGVVDFFLVIRLLRLFKVLGTIDRFKVILETVFQLGPAITMFGLMVLVSCLTRTIAVFVPILLCSFLTIQAVYYAFAIVGMELFSGEIYEGNSTLPGSFLNKTSPFGADLTAGNPALIHSEFGESGYYPNNFNDIVASFVLLFELTVVNQWHVLTHGFVLLTSKAARLYFLAFHLTAVILILSVFIAFILEAFLLQREASRTELQGELHEQVEIELAALPAGTKRFRVASGLRSTDALFYRMFAGEILNELEMQESCLELNVPPHLVDGQGTVVVSAPSNRRSSTPNGVVTLHADDWDEQPHTHDSSGGVTSLRESAA